MRVLYFMNHVGQGGAALALYDLIIELKNNYDVDAVVFTGKRNELNEMLDIVDIENYVSPYKNFMSTALNPHWLWRILYKIRHDFYLPIALQKIEYTVDISKFDLIHSNLNRIDIGAIVAQKYHKPHLWHIREHARGSFELISIKSDIAAYMESFKNRYVAISKSVKNVWSDIGLPDERIDLIYDGVNTEYLHPSENLYKDKIKILFLGGYNPSKGQEMLLDAVIKLPEAYRKKLEVDFFGNGIEEYRQKLLKKIKKNNLETIIHLNSYDSGVYLKLNQYDIGVNCSKNEGFGRVTVEYMLAGLCTIATFTGASPEVIENGETGFLFEYGNIEEFCERLTYLIDNRNVLRECGLNASQYARKKFSMKTHAELIYQEYTRLLEKRV